MMNGASAKEIEAGDPRGRLETAVASWPTPTAQMSKHAAPTEYELRRGAEYAAMHLHVAAWPTPTSRDWKDGACQSADVESNALLGRVALEGTTTGALNPDWVESLMGFPAGWTVTDGPQGAALRSTSGKPRASRKAPPSDASG
jgi:DNA (cytosine-5)-methyltransferase 1